MTLGRRPLVALGIFVYLAGLFAFVPAGWIAPIFERATGGAAILGDSSGTLWHGKAALAVRSGGLYQRLANIEWRCNPLWLVTGRAHFTITGSAPDTDISAAISAGTSGVRIDDLKAVASASVVESVLPALGFVGPEGRLRVHATGLEITRMTVRGAATVEWENAGLRKWQWSDLGDYRIDATGAGDRADFKLTTLRGDLLLSGDGVWRPAQPDALQLKGIAENPNGRKDLELLLRMISGGATGPRQSFTLSLPAQ